MCNVCDNTGYVIDFWGYTHPCKKCNYHLHDDTP